MSNFNKIIELSRKIANSILRKDDTTILEKSKLFSDHNKEYILEQLTNEKHIKDRLDLIHQINKKEDWKKIKKRIKVPVLKLVILKYTSTVAVIAIVASIFFYKNDVLTSPQETTPLIIKSTINPGTNKAILVLGSGEEVVLGNGSNYKTNTINSNGEKITYDKGNSNLEEIANNYLIVPRGGEYTVQLSDGTKVWLNSDSKLKYPVTFVDGKVRKVELVYGEAYFEVSPSTLHKGSKFEVFTKKQTVQVIGTQFNIKAYPDENNIYTTLVEGKVAVTIANNEQFLAPKEQSNYNLVNNSIQISKVDIYSAVAWKEGFFSFRAMPLNEIMKVLSRWYNVDVTFSNKKLEKVKFNGVLRKDQDITKILETIKITKSINSYDINNKQIIIK